MAHNELYFAAPATFNDPFDCAPRFSFDATDAEILAYYTRVALKHAPDVPTELTMLNAHVKLHDKSTGPRSRTAQANVQRLHQETVAEKVGVLCLSERRDSILMWAHYASNHQGVCLGFDTRHKFFANTHQIRYTEQRPTVNAFRDSTEQMLEAALLSKSVQWSYEHEWRLMSYTQGPGVYKFPSNTLAVVILGCKSSSSTREIVKSWLRARKHRPRLLQATQSNNEYAFRFTTVAY